MDSQQIVDYIGQHLGAGHSEATLREHLTRHGWSQTAADDAFARYYQTQPVTKAKPRHHISAIKRPKLHVKGLASRRIKLGIAGAVVVVAAVVGLHIMQSQRTPHIVVPPPPPLTQTQKQSIDVSNLGGAVGQYVAANGATPAAVSVGEDGNLVLCSNVCDPVTSEVVPLAIYKAMGVKFQAYAAGLAVSDTRTMYLVAGANCTGPKQTLNASTNPEAMAILYAQANGSALKQRCVTL